MRLSDLAQRFTSGRAGGRTETGIAVAVLAAAAFVAHTHWRAKGVRGTDQYWYLSDVEMLETTGRPIGNHIFPRFIDPLGPKTADDPPPWIHHLPVTYLVARVNRRVKDPYRSWTITNTALVLAGAGVVAAAAGTVAGGRVGMAAGVATLTLPSSTWLSLNALSEAALVPLGAGLASAALAMDSGHLTTGTLALSAVSALMYLQRDNHIPQVLASAATTWWLRSRGNVSTVTAVASSVALGASVAIGTTRMSSAMSLLKPSEILMATIGDNTVIYTRLRWSTRTFLSKAVPGIRAATLPQGAQSALEQTLPLAVLGVSAAKLARQGSHPWLITAAGGSVVQYLLTAGTFGVQPRYAAPLQPLAVITAVAAYGNHRRALPVAAAASLLFATVSAGLGRHYAREATAEARDVAVLRQALEGLPNGNVLQISEDTTDALSPYVAVPRFFLSSSPHFQDKQWIAGRVVDWNVVVALTTGDNDRLLHDALPDWSITQIARMPIRGEQATVWRLERTP